MEAVCVRALARELRYRLACMCVRVRPSVLNSFNSIHNTLLVCCRGGGFVGGGSCRCGGGEWSGSELSEGCCVRLVVESAAVELIEMMGSNT